MPRAQRRSLAGVWRAEAGFADRSMLDRCMIDLQASSGSCASVRASGGKWPRTACVLRPSGIEEQHHLFQRLRDRGMLGTF